jgi:recombination protein RecT
MPPTPAPTTAVAKRDAHVTAFRAVEAQLTARRERLLEVLPAKIGPDRFIRVALGAMSRQPVLFDCTTESLVKSMLDSAELGLEPTGLMGQAYLVPYRNKGTLEAQLIVGYRGLAELARRSGLVSSIEARIVRDRDDFSVQYGTQPSIHHVPYLPGLMGSPGAEDDDAPADGAGNFRAAYAVLTYTDGSRYIEVMTEAEVLAIRARSRAKDSGPWVTDPMEMARKTVLRRALKYGPLAVLDSRTAEALDAEDQRTFREVKDVTPEQPDQAADAIQAAAAQVRRSARGQAPEPPVEALETAQDATDQVDSTQDPAEPEAAQGDDPDDGLPAMGDLVDDLSALDHDR